MNSWCKYSDFLCVGCPTWPRMHVCVNSRWNFSEVFQAQQWEEVRCGQFFPGHDTFKQATGILVNYHISTSVILTVMILAIAVKIAVCIFKYFFCDYYDFYRVIRIIWKTEFSSVYETSLMVQFQSNSFFWERQGPDSYLVEKYLWKCT